MKKTLSDKAKADFQKRFYENIDDILWILLCQEIIVTTL